MKARSIKSIPANAFRLFAIGFVLLSIAACLLLFPARGEAALDPRKVPITAAQLKAALATVPLNSEQNLTLILRARESGILTTALSLCEARLKRQPDNAYAKFWYGVAAGRFFANSLQTGVRGGSTRQQAAFAAARDILPEAAAARPKDALVQAESGFFLWQYGSTMEIGLALVKKAEKLAPDNTRVLTILGDIHRNPTGNAYDAAAAKRCFRRVAALDPQYAFPQMCLAVMAVAEKKKALAKEYLQSYLALCPPKEAEDRGIKDFEASIEALP